MALEKRDYTEHQTVITAKNLNDIQEEIIGNCVTGDNLPNKLDSTKKGYARAQIGAVSSDEVNTAVNTSNIVVVSGTISDSNRTLTNNMITANHVLLNAEITTPSAQGSDWTVATARSNDVGTVTISGTISTSTPVKLYFGLPRT